MKTKQDSKKEEQKKRGSGSLEGKLGGKTREESQKKAEEEREGKRIEGTREEYQGRRVQKS